MGDNSKFRVLVVDDEPIARSAISDLLRQGKCLTDAVLCACNAFEALNILKTERVELAIVDIRMPVMDGLQLTEKIRETWPQMSVIIVSGYADFEYARSALRYGVSDYLLKPVDEASLLSAVGKVRTARVQGSKEKAGDRSRFSPTVRRLMEILDEEIGSEHLTLRWISGEKMFLNENYLGQRFQDETGQRFTAYLLDRRMELAMHLIASDPNLQVQEVAAQCGYGDNPRYFSSVFKKYTDKTPLEYRKSVMGSGQSNK